MDPINKQNKKQSECVMSSSSQQRFTNEEVALSMQKMIEN